jgi:hypothetical protein
MPGLAGRRLSTCRQCRAGDRVSAVPVRIDMCMQQQQPARRLLHHRTDDLVAAAVILPCPRAPAGAGARSERPDNRADRCQHARSLPSRTPTPTAKCPNAKPAPTRPGVRRDNYWDLASAPTTPLKDPQNRKAKGKAVLVCTVQYQSH